MNKEQQLKKLAKKIKTCSACPLARRRTQAVPGEGNAATKIIFVGEGPGKQEDEQGRPFVGQAGKLLDELFEEAGLERKDIFITNIVKCRPPGNRDPQEEEIQACWPYLEQQIEIINPQLIIPLGRHAMYKFLPDNLKISRDHGKVFKKLEQRTGQYRFYYPVYHPAAALYHGSIKEILKRDFKKIPRVLKKIDKE